MQYCAFRFLAYVARHLFAAIFLISSASADDAVTFAIPDVWPWAYETESGELGGSLIDVAGRLSEITGIPVELQLRPLRRTIVELRSGEADFSILFQNPELDIEVINVASVTRVKILLAAMADSEYPLTLQDLEGRRVAYIRGTYLGEDFEADTDVLKVPVNGVGQALELLSLGRISAILASDHNIYRTLSSRDMPRDLLRYHEHVSGQNGTLYISRVARRPEAAREFAAAIEQMSADGELDEIFYGERRNTESQHTGSSAQ